MGSPAKKKARSIPECEGEDRISALPDELIHKIYSFLDATQAVQSSVLSKRWELIWTTLPFLKFNGYDYGDHDYISRYTMLIRHVLSNRNHRSHLFKLKMHVRNKLIVKQRVSKKKFRGCVIEKFIQYAILHNVNYLDIRLKYTHEPYKLSTFNSKSLKKLTLQMELEKCQQDSDYWDLPALTTLYLKRRYRCGVGYNLHESWLTSLPALRTLTLDFWDLSETCFSLPNLTSLLLYDGELPQAVWHLPSLVSLHLEDVDLPNNMSDLYVDLPNNMSDLFSALVNLEHLTLILGSKSTQRDHFISCPRLLNLNIRTHFDTRPYGDIVVSCPELCNFSSFGIFLVKVVVPELEIVNITLNGWFVRASHVSKKNCCRWFTRMLSGLGTAKNLSFDLESIEALSEIINIQASVSSPFINLKYLKLPKEYKESSLSSALRSYLLGGCPRASIVTEMPQDNIIPQTATVPMTVGNAALEGPYATPTKGLVDCQYINCTVNIETGDLAIQEKHVEENYLLDADRVRQIDSSVEGTSKNRVSSLKGKRDFGLWQGYEVNAEFVCLLDCIMQKYPETFKHFTTKNKKLSTVRLNMLCTSLNDFTKISRAEVDSEIIAQYRDIFAYLQSMGFNLSWVLSHLNYLEHLRFSNPLIMERQAIDCRIDDAKSEVQDLQARVGESIDKLQNLQTLRAEKMTEIEEKIGKSGTNLSVGLIGDDLLSAP